MHTDHREYFKFTGRSRLDKAMNSLVGLVEGISIDGAINASEIGFLRLWLQENREIRNLHPFSELMPVVEAAIADGVLTDDERQDILWLCEKLRSTEYFDATTADIQRLHALMAGITSDGVITEAELRGLSTWLSDHDQLKTCWPYDEVDSLITTVLSDGKIDAAEHKLLQSFFGEFVAVLDIWLHLARLEAHRPPIVPDLFKGLFKVSNDPFGAPPALDEGHLVTWIASLTVELTRIKESAARIEQAGAPKLASRVCSLPVEMSGEDAVFPVIWRKAWNWARMRTYLDNIEARNELLALSARRRDLEGGLSRLYKDLVSKAAWLATKRNATPKVLQALAGYATAIRRIGQGTGPNATR